MDSSYALRVAGHKARMRGFDLAVKVLRLNQPRLMIGPGSITRLADHIGTYGFERLLVVTDPGIVKLGLQSDCVERLVANGIDVLVYDAIEPNPTEQQIERGIALARAERSEAVLGFGGGSAIDAAKVIAAGVTNDKPVARSEGPFKVRRQPLPTFRRPDHVGNRGGGDDRGSRHQRGRAAQVPGCRPEAGAARRRSRPGDHRRAAAGDHRRDRHGRAHARDRVLRLAPAPRPRASAPRRRR